MNIDQDFIDRARSQQENEEQQATYRSQLTERLLIDAIFFERNLRLLHHIVHDPLVHGTLWL